MRVPTGSLHLIAILLALTGGLASGQTEVRRGLSIGVGSGYGVVKWSCANCAPDSWTGGLTGFVKGGGTLSPSVRLGASLDGWDHSTSGANETMANIAASVDCYPLASKRLFVTGGLGLSIYRLATSPAVTGRGWGLMLGLGYDVPTSPKVSLTPVARFMYGRVGDLTIADGGAVFATGWKQSLLYAGLAVTWGP